MYKLKKMSTIKLPSNPGLMAKYIIGLQPVNEAKHKWKKQKLKIQYAYDREKNTVWMTFIASILWSIGTIVLSFHKHHVINYIFLMGAIVCFITGIYSIRYYKDMMVRLMVHNMKEPQEGDC
ncbi:MAG: hypothetical protein KAS32_06720 [Candidatus Peribacteraceae bacterium]|nr:hypothetical protein [Candidatus Peribacteraceae bacterium]